MLLAEKAALRRLCRAQRDALPASERERLSLAACTLIHGDPLWQSAKTVLAYWPMASELDLRPLIRWSWQEKKQVLLPRCCFQPRGLTLCRVNGWEDLLPGAYGIAEPSASCLQVEPAQVELALVPVVAMDRRACRLGQGGGFYDRLLPSLPLAYLVGFDCQLLPRLPLEPHDAPAHGWITPTEWRKTF